MENQLTKWTEIPEKFHRTPAMTPDWWKNAACKKKSRLTRGAMHGYHHFICSRGAKFHEIDRNRTCVLCDQECDDYHLYECPRADRIDWSKDENHT